MRTSPTVRTTVVTRTAVASASRVACWISRIVFSSSARSEAPQSSSSSPGGGCSVSEQAEWSGGGSAHSSAPHETVDASSHASCGAGQAQDTDVSSTAKVLSAFWMRSNETE